MLIDGRKIRVERAKAESELNLLRCGRGSANLVTGAVILSKHDGRPISESEARQLLSKFGPIELCAPTNTMDSARYNMACGIYVKFAYYLDCRDALRVSIGPLRAFEYQSNRTELQKPHTGLHSSDGPIGGTTHPWHFQWISCRSWLLYPSVGC